MTNKPNQYSSAARKLAKKHKITVTRWRANSTGIAYEDGTIEAPEPRGPVTFGVFAHEVGHVALDHHRGSRPRWLEELEAWQFALEQFDLYELPGRFKAEQDAGKSMAYAYAKAIRRGANPDDLKFHNPGWMQLAWECDKYGRLNSALKKALLAL